jgi:hypothetical protein
MKYDIEIISDAMVYILIFIQVGSGIQKLMGERGYIYIKNR